MPSVTAPATFTFSDLGIDVGESSVSGFTEGDASNSGPAFA